MDIEKSRLGIEGDGKTDIIDLRCDTIMIGSIINKKGYLPAYHMSKKNWITAIINETNENELKDLICLSYEIIDSRKK